jgi:hypothetical protein
MSRTSQTGLLWAGSFLRCITPQTEGFRHLTSLFRCPTCGAARHKAPEETAAREHRAASSLAARIRPSVDALTDWAQQRLYAMAVGPAIRRTPRQQVRHDKALQERI